MLEDESQSRCSSRFLGLSLGILALLTVVAGLAFTAYWIGGPVIHPSLLRQIKPGMSQADVVRNLGDPVAESSGPECWIYERKGNPGWVEISFDKRGRVQYVNDESPFRME